MAASSCRSCVRPRGTVSRPEHTNAHTPCTLVANSGAIITHEGQEGALGSACIIQQVPPRPQPINVQTGVGPDSHD
ncbi:hypothetical protein EYC84_007699 [Monilinia fructicola]|uniref:Uncharacterized protein n=1 Tax=Monilinia fructicola TaxID=38448 RepID=A0A5M9JGM1_MONFR|nr:hypothetical protein EYC84_007699 [Monilinia fructicola]